MHCTQRFWILAICLTALAVLTACASGPDSGKGRSKKPGMYGSIIRWNEGVADIKGEVGHGLSIVGPRTRCEPNGKWLGRVQIISGSFPPGVNFSQSELGITGVPKERGHWIVTIRLDQITCSGILYDQLAFEQELRFHISGSGRVLD